MVCDIYIHSLCSTCKKELYILCVLLFWQHTFFVEGFNDETIEKTVYEFTSRNSAEIPYLPINYLFTAASSLIKPQAIMTVKLAVSYSIARICKISGFGAENIIDRRKDMRNYSYSNKSISDNIKIIKNSSFYKLNF